MKLICGMFSLLTLFGCGGNNSAIEPKTEPKTIIPQKTYNSVASFIVGVDNQFEEAQFDLGYQILS